MEQKVRMWHVAEFSSDTGILIEANDNSDFFPKKGSKLRGEGVVVQKIYNIFPVSANI
jgi:hypothetical protein